jgi:ParB/RepB/Spo0J family partition protein
MAKADPTLKSKELVVFVKLHDLHSSPLQSRFQPFTTVKEQSGPPPDIDELAESIEKNGLMQPVMVRPVENGYEIIDGHRRVQAMQKLGRGQILAIIRNMTEHEAQVMHVIGNLQRRNLKPVELALTCQKMLDSGVFKDKRELSKAIGKDETYVGDLLSTLQLDSRILEDLARHNLIKDLRVLRLIRLIEPVDTRGVSNAQWELYRKVLFTKMGRKELAVLIKKSQYKMPALSWKMNQHAKKITIHLETGPVKPAQRDQLLKLVTEKMTEMCDSMGQFK